MKYKFILQEMKEASDPNVKAFLKDVERMKRLTKQEKDFYLKTRYLSSSVKKLVEDFIPYVIYVAYSYSQKTKTLQMLDLINEGILGAYAAFDYSAKYGILTKRRVQNSIKNYIRRAVNKDMCQSIADYTFDTCMHERPMNDEGVITEIDRSYVKRVLNDMLEDSLGERDTSIIFDYYWGKVENIKELSIKYGITSERCRQIIRSVEFLSYSDIHKLKIDLM